MPSSINTLSFQCTAENGPATFEKITGPDWLNLSPTGLFSGTPPFVAATYDSLFKLYNVHGSIYYVFKVTVNLPLTPTETPTPTPTLITTETPTPTPTLITTETPTPTPTLITTETPTLITTETPTPTLITTETPTPTPTLITTETPTPTLTPTLTPTPTETLSECGFLVDGQRYLTQTITETDGHTITTTYTGDIDPGTGECISTTTCAGTVVETFNRFFTDAMTYTYEDGSFYIFHDATRTTTTTYNSDCSTTVTVTCEGVNIYESIGSGDNTSEIICESELTEGDCSLENLANGPSWVFNATCTEFNTLNGPSGACTGWEPTGNSPCWDILLYNNEYVDTYTTTPEPIESPIIGYTNPV